MLVYIESDRATDYVRSGYLHSDFSRRRVCLAMSTGNRESFSVYVDVGRRGSGGGVGGTGGALFSPSNPG